MKTIKPLIVWFISILVSLFIVAHAKAEGSTNAEFKSVTDGIFSFQVPATWRKMVNSELRVFKQQYELQSSELFKQYHGRAESYESGVASVVGYFSPNFEVTFVALVMKIPVQAKDYLREIYERSKDVIKWGKSQGQVRHAHINRITNVNGIPALETDLEMGNGSRMVNYSIYSKNQPDQAIQVSLLFSPGTYSKHHTERSRILNSLQLNYKK